MGAAGSGHPRRLSINHSLPPLSYLPRNQAGEKMKEGSQFFTQGVGAKL
jgi:hypothetical protein